MEEVIIRPMNEGELDDMIVQHEELNPSRPIRPDTREALINYKDKGWEPGGFLSAVLENNLMEAFGRADSYNRASLFEITSFLYNNMPSNCWGSPEIVKEYLANFKTSQV